MTKWKIEFVASVDKLSNGELLDETLSAAQGDDYDGEFSHQGQWEYEYLILELQNRLGDWLNE